MLFAEAFISIFHSAYSLTISISETSSLLQRELSSSLTSILSSKSKEVFGSQVILLDFVHLEFSIQIQT
jgi:hypothetical protein